MPSVSLPPEILHWSQLLGTPALPAVRDSTELAPRCVAGSPVRALTPALWRWMEQAPVTVSVIVPHTVPEVQHHLCPVGHTQLMRLTMCVKHGPSAWETCWVRCHRLPLPATQVRYYSAVKRR